MENQKKSVLVKQFTVKSRDAYMIKNICLFKKYCGNTIIAPWISNCSIRCR